MSLSSKLVSQFGSNDRIRGADYHFRGNVTHLELLDGNLIADVEGGYGNYEVVIDLDNLEDDEGLNCSCPRFADGFPCKHLWAVILQFDETRSALGYNTAFDDTKSQGNGKRIGKKKTTAPPKWQAVLKRAHVDALNWNRNDQSRRPARPDDFRESEILYVIDVSSLNHYSYQLELLVFHRRKRNDGEWGQLKRYGLTHNLHEEIRLKDDQRIASLLLGVNRSYNNYSSYGSAASSFSTFKVEPFWTPELCSMLISSKRLFWSKHSIPKFDDLHLISSIDFENPAQIALGVKDQNKQSTTAELKVEIKDSDRLIRDSEVVAIAKNGILLTTDKVRLLVNPEAAELWKMLKDNPTIQIDKSERPQFLELVAEQNLFSQIELPKSWKVGKTESFEPEPILRITEDSYRKTQLQGTIAFLYGDTEVALSSSRDTFFESGKNSWFHRNSEKESERLKDLMDVTLNWKLRDQWTDYDFTFSQKKLVSMVDLLVERGWKVELHGKPIRKSSSFDISIESGQDWFDLSVKVDFDGNMIALPQLLRAISRKQEFVELSDGSQGRIPEESIEKFARLAGFGRTEDNKVRFHLTQAMLLDAMLDSRDVRTDTSFQKFRNKLRSFDGIKPKKPTRTFKGELRDYQTEGLGWLHFLREFQLGGCLADDMGLGKTIQVLALLEHRRTRRVKDDSDQNQNQVAQTQAAAGDDTKKKQRTSASKPESASDSVAQLKRKPSIVVVPKSLIFNWMEEAAKFTPNLRVLNYTGTKRTQTVKETVDAEGFDVLITTYGTMQKDIDELSKIKFDYAILDESQAIKNASANCSKASRLLSADHRLAMTGTPVENHLGELWSLFEFLNPGLLGSSSGFAKLTNQKKHNEAQREETLSALSRALKPFLLRRTKEQVITELPPKTEQTLYCDMLPAQEKAYKELKEYYRVKLAKKIETEGIGRSKIHVLEALLRLRQVACDPRLVKESAKPGAKLELLQEQISNIISDGHKVLVFSQFTSLLSLVKTQFDQQGIGYEYLDGKSRKRAGSVKRFQEDPTVQAFLISIKAGGYGLNLTAADYVFLLDPWWNPAVEAQAIDRAHRIGQNNPVIAYRLVCRKTVEEKILALQESKRELAEKVIRSDESLIRSLTPDDLQLILS